MEVPMSDLLIQLTKRTDGDAMLRCVRPDGTATWQRHRGGRAAFFPLHDLTHFVVESELGFRRGFYGLIAEGWDISDTGESRRRGPLPPEAVVVEHLVGLLDTRRAQGSAWTAAELNAQVAALVAAGKIPPTPAVSNAAWVRLRTRLDGLLARWALLPPGGTLELSFDRAATPEP
jgi:hypothetical protein